MNLEEQKQRGTLMLQAIHLFEDVLVMMAQAILVRMPLEPKMRLLLAFHAKLQDTTHGIRTLAPHGLAEDIWGLVRPLTENVINLSYLQLAEEEELISFQAYPGVAYLHQLKQLESVMGESFAGVDDAKRAEIAKSVEDANTRVGRVIRPENWSKLNLAERVLAVDRNLGLRLFRGLYRSVYSSGHASVHGTYSSLRYYDEVLMGSREKSDVRRLAELHLPVSATAQCLFAYATFLDEYYFGHAYRSQILAAMALLEEAHTLSGLPLGNFTL